MSDNELIGYVQKNAQIGLQTIPRILEKNSDPEFARMLYENEKLYSSIYRETKSALGVEAGSDNDIGAYGRLREDVMEKAASAANTSTSYLAEMMVVGNTMGIIELTRGLRRNPRASSAAKELALKLLINEEESIEEMKRFI